MPYLCKHTNEKQIAMKLKQS